MKVLLIFCLVFICQFKIIKCQPKLSYCGGANIDPDIKINQRKLDEFCKQCLNTETGMVNESSNCNRLAESIVRLPPNCPTIPKTHFGRMCNINVKSQQNNTVPIMVNSE